MTRWNRLVAIAFVGGMAGPAGAVTLAPQDVFIHEIAWLEANQNADGSWGAGPTTALATAEALNALAAADRTPAPAAQKAIAWLRTREYPNLDYRARAVRALAAAGQDVLDEGKALRNLSGPPGYGPTAREGVTAYDTALVAGAVKATGSGNKAGTPEEVPARAFLFDSPNTGSPLALWVGESVGEGLDPAGITAGLADGTLSVEGTAEVLRAMAWVQQDPAYNDPVDPAYGRALVALEETTFGPTTDTLELALRLVAYHAWGHAVPSGFDAELLDEARFTAEMTSPGIPVRYVDDPDPFVHAMVLLAVAADPAFIPPTAGDVDGDLVADAGDAFPYDPFFTADMDGDGIPDGIDEDLDGDGTPNDVDGPSGLFADDPTEWADADGDGTGDNADDMDDSDSLSDLAEVALGTDPTNPADRRNKRSFEVREPPVMTNPRGNSG